MQCRSYGILAIIFGGISGIRQRKVFIRLMAGEGEAYGAQPWLS